jgi:ABC-type multidrug transport system ATPase subunit
VPQKLGLFDELSVRENLEYPARLHGRSSSSAAGSTS